MNVYQPDKTTVIICAAGMGTRLGIGTTKALVDIGGTPLIIRQLELLKDYDDIRVVVGFQAERLIKIIMEYRKDIMFAFNYQYEITGVADSLRKGLLGAREYVISLDGDVLVNPNDFINFITYEGECLGISHISSEEPIKATVKEGKVLCLSKTEGNMQWPGIVRIKRNRIMEDFSYVYEILNELLPLPAIQLRTREINTQEDYDNAMDWFEKGQKD